jgi:hypothetical protein
MRDSISKSYPPGVQFYANERTADIENRLRTHMMNGTDPKELEQAMLRQFLASQQQR